MRHEILATPLSLALNPLTVDAVFQRCGHVFQVMSRPFHHLPSAPHLLTSMSIWEGVVLAQLSEWLVYIPNPMVWSNPLLLSPMELTSNLAPPRRPEDANCKTEPQNSGISSPTAAIVGHVPKRAPAKWKHKLPDEFAEDEEMEAEQLKRQCLVGTCLQ